MKLDQPALNLTGTQAIFRGIQELRAELSAAPALAALQDHVAGQPDLQVSPAPPRLRYLQRVHKGVQAAFIGSAVAAAVTPMVCGPVRLLRYIY